VAGTLALVGMADAIRDDADLAVVGRLRETAAELSGALGHITLRSKGGYIRYREEDNNRLKGLLDPRFRVGRVILSQKCSRTSPQRRANDTKATWNPLRSPQ
jgi:hypothetical protein